MRTPLTFVGARAASPVGALRLRSPGAVGGHVGKNANPDDGHALQILPTGSAPWSFAAQWLWNDTCWYRAAMGGARHYSELIAWRLADAARVVVFTFTRRPPFSTDFKPRSQAEDAIDSVCRNIAEGFGCESHAEFARYLEISRRSLNELCDCIRSAQLKGYISINEAAELHALSRRLYPALNNFIAYLKRTPTSRRGRPNTPRNNQGVAFRRHLLELLSEQPRSISSLAHELGIKRGDVEEDLRHALRSARAAGHQIEVIPARCKACDFVFGDDKLTKPGRCPRCKGTRLFEPMIRVVRTE